MSTRQPCRSCKRNRKAGKPTGHCSYCGRHHKDPGYHKNRYSPVGK